MLDLSDAGRKRALNDLSKQWSNQSGIVATSGYENNTSCTVIRHYYTLYH